MVQKGVDLNSTNTTGIIPALSVVQEADIVVLCIGIGYDQEHEGIDRPNTTLPGLQERFALEVLAFGKPTVIVLINGGIVSIEGLISPASAIIEAFYPAMRGAEAIFTAIFTTANRWGKLPVTIYNRNYTNEVDMYNFNMTLSPGRTYRYYTGLPLFPFGFGLSLTTFSLSCELKWSIDFGLDIIYCQLKNTGKLRGDNVIMMYHRVSMEIAHSVDHPVPHRALVNFHRVTVEVRETVSLLFLITDEDLAVTNNDGILVVYPGIHYFELTDGVSPPSLIPVFVPSRKMVTDSPRPE